MTLDVFQKSAVPIMNPALSPEQCITSCALGLADEFGELAMALYDAPYDAPRSVLTDEQRANLREELGDLMWYSSVALFHIGHLLPAIADVPSSSGVGIFDDNVGSCVIRLLVDANPFIMQAKRLAFHGHTKDDSIQRQMENSLLAVINGISDIAKLTGIGSLSEICDANITKLHKRYPGGKFTTAASVNRTT